MYLHTLFLYSIYDKVQGSIKDGEEMNALDFIPKLFQRYSNFLLYREINKEYLSLLDTE